MPTAILLATIAVLAVAETHGLVITAAKASLYDGIAVAESLAAQWPQRLVMTPLILVAAAIGAPSRRLAAVAAVVAVAWAAACLLVPIDLPHQSYPWLRLDSYGWDRSPDTVQPGAITPIRAAGVLVAAGAASVVAVAPAAPAASRVSLALAVGAAVILAIGPMLVGWGWLDAIHGVLVVLAVAWFAGGRPVLGAVLLGIVAIAVSGSVAYDAAWLESATSWDLGPIVVATAGAWALVVVLAVVGAVAARRARGGA